MREAAGAQTLTAKEQGLFDLLSGSRGRLFSRAEILERVWGLAYAGDDRIVDAYVKRVRRKLGESVIETVRGTGYRRPAEARARQALPHFGHLSPDARTVLELGRRAMGAGTTGDVLREVRAVLAPTLGVAAAALLVPGEPGPGWEVRDACGETGLNWCALPLPETPTPAYVRSPGHHTRPVALLPLVGVDGPWGILGVAAEAGAVWDSGAYAQLEAVAALVGGALRLRLETEWRVRAQEELRALNADLEERVRQRTAALAQAQAEGATLHALSRGLEQTASVPELLSVALPMLARLAGLDACAAYFPRRGSAPLACYRADGSPAGAPHLGEVRAPRGVWLAGEVGGDEFTLYAFGEAGHAGGASPLLHAAAQSVTLMLARLLYLETLETAALTDETTGLGNRQAFLADLTGEVAYSTRHGAGFALALVEVANIRFLNATVGYAGGNDALLRVAGTLRAARRAEDRAYRLGGATFAVLLRLPPQGPGGRALEGWRERLGSVLADLARSAPSPLELHVADVSCPGDARTSSDLLRLVLEHLGPVRASPLHGGGLYAGR